MDSSGVMVAQQMGEMPPWVAAAMPVYQAPEHCQPNSYTSFNNSGQALDWGASHGGYHESRQHNTRGNQQWSNSKRRPQNKHATNFGQQMAAPPPPPPPMWQPPIAATANPVALDLQKPRQSVAVALSGLPQQLCRQILLEAMLEQAGLTESIVGCMLGQEQDLGKAVIYFCDRNSAQMCVEHFGGCCWERNGACITAQVMDEEGPSGQGRQATGNVNVNHGLDRAPGGKARKQHSTQESRQSKPARMSNKSWKMDNSPHGSQPLPDFGCAMAMPQAMPALPIAVCDPSWSGDFTQLPIAKHEMVYDSPDENSTIAGGSTGRASCDMTGSPIGFAEDYACDTDDGF